MRLQLQLRNDAAGKSSEEAVLHGFDALLEMRLLDELGGARGAEALFLLQHRRDVSILQPVWMGFQSRVQDIGQGSCRFNGIVAALAGKRFELRDRLQSRLHGQRKQRTYLVGRIPNGHDPAKVPPLQDVLLQRGQD